MMQDSYDQIQDDRSSLRSGRGSRGKTVAVVLLLGIAILVIALFFGWNKLFPPETPKEVTITTQPVAPPIMQVEDAPAVEESTPAPAPVESSAPPAPAPEPAARPSMQAVSLAETSSPNRSASGEAVQFADHTVAEGETLDAIAARYGLKVQTIISVNQIRNINAVQTGTVLRIPDRDGQLYVVKEGDMLSKIARDYGMGWQTLMNLNGLTSEFIRIGQKLFIPDTSATQGAEAAAQASVQFQRPAEGEVIAKFGHDQADGILIAGAWNDPVYAAADGDVVDVGRKDDLGRFVVISHEDGYKTTYGHLENIEVKAGTKVAKGTLIGSMGGTASSDQASLYFKIEQSGYALDPESFF